MTTGRSINAMAHRTLTYLKSARESPGAMLAVIYMTFFLDYFLLSAIVPIIPDMLVDSDKCQEQRCSTRNISDVNVTYPTNSTTANDVTGQILLVSFRAINENSRVGFILSSKAIVQLVVNPVIGMLSNRLSYEALMLFGVCVFLGSSLIYTVAGSFVPLLLARALQGVGSAATTIAGMSLIAGIYKTDEDRSRAIGIAMGGLAMGILVGYPYGGLLYAVSHKAVPFLGISGLCAINIGLQLFIRSSGTNFKVENKPPAFRKLLKDPNILICAGAIMFSSMCLAVLESTVPIWIMDTMDATSWQLGIIFIPDSIGYLVGTHCFPVVAQTHGRWFFSTASFLVIVVGLIVIPFCSSIVQLILPHLFLGLGVGVVDAAITPLMALLVDQNHVTTYGSVYAVFQLAVCLAYSLGPAIAGMLVRAVGFRWTMWGLALANLIFTPFNWFLRNTSIAEDKQKILEEDECAVEKESFGLKKLGNGYTYEAFHDGAVHGTD